MPWLYDVKDRAFFPLQNMIFPEEKHMVKNTTNLVPKYRQWLLTYSKITLTLMLEGWLEFFRTGINFPYVPHKETVSINAVRRKNNLEHTQSNILTHSERENFIWT